MKNVESAKRTAEKGTRGGNNLEEKKNQGSKEKRTAEEAEAIVKLVVPLPKIKIGAAEGERQKSLPILAPTDEERGGAKKQEIAEENHLLVPAAAHERGGEEPTEEGKKSDALGISTQGEERHDGGDEDEGGETDLAREERVVLTAGPHRNEKSGFAETGDAFGEVSVIAGEKPIAPREHEQPKENANGDASGGADPVVVKGQLEEIGDGEEKGNDADAIEPTAPDERFEIGGGGVPGNLGERGYGR